MAKGLSARSIIVMATLCLVAQHYLITDGWIQQKAVAVLYRWFEPLSSDLAAWLMGNPNWVANATWAVSSAFLFLVVPVCWLRISGAPSLGEYGLRWPINVPGKQMAAISLGVFGAIYAVHDLDAFRAVYPFYKAPQLYPHWLWFEVLYLGQFVALEFFFRGALLHGLEPSMGRTAIWVSTLPYVMVHFQKPWPETLGALIAGAILCELSLRTRSIWPGALLHMFAAITMDLLVLEF